MSVKGDRREHEIQHAKYFSHIDESATAQQQTHVNRSKLMAPSGLTPFTVNSLAVLNERKDVMRHLCIYATVMHFLVCAYGPAHGDKSDCGRSVPNTC